MAAGIESNIARAGSEPVAHDGITLSQFYDLRRASLPADPEVAGAMRLMMAIIETAVEDYLAPYWSGGDQGDEFAFLYELPHRRRTAMAHTAEKWIFTIGGTLPFSFEKLCDGLDWNPEWLRKRLRAKKAELITANRPKI